MLKAGLILISCYPLYMSVKNGRSSEHDLHVMIEKSDKKRYEISNGKIRALYGHSIPQRIIKEQKCPPEVLYHGTARRFVKS